MESFPNFLITHKLQYFVLYLLKVYCLKRDVNGALKPTSVTVVKYTIHKIET